MPAGIPIMPSIKPSKSTLCLICFDVAPIEASIPYNFVFSVIEIAKLLRITKILEIAIITIIITANEKSILIYSSLSAKPLYLSKSLFILASSKSPFSR